MVSQHYVTMKHFLLVAIVAISQFAATDLAAQEVQRITFSEVVNIALDRSTAIRSSGYNLDLESSRVSSARADFLPDLNAGINPSANFGLTFDQNSLQLVNRTSYFSNVGLSSSVNLFRGFGDVAALKQARHNFDAADYTLDRTRQDVLQTAIINYLQVTQDRENVKIQEENVKSQHRLLERIQAFTHVGTRPVSDLYTQEANTAQAELDLLNSERAAQLSQARLVGQLLLDPLNDYEFVAPSSDEVDLSPILYDPVSLIRNAFSERLDLQAQNSRIEAAEQGVRTAKAAFWPVVNLIGQYGTSYSSSDALDRPIIDQGIDNRSGSIRIGLTIPIFNRFDTKLRVEQSRLVERNARLDLESLQQRVALEVRQAYLDYQTAVKQLEVSDRRLQSAQQALDAEQERYNVGASTLVELTQVQAQYVSASSGRINAVVNYVARVALIDYFVGTISPEASIF